jgi:hypothetical protein
MPWALHSQSGITQGPVDEKSLTDGRDQGSRSGSLRIGTQLTIVAASDQESEVLLCTLRTFVRLPEQLFSALFTCRAAFTTF